MSGLSWDGNNITGDEKSIRAVQAALHEAGKVPALMRRLNELAEEVRKANMKALQYYYGSPEWKKNQEALLFGRKNDSSQT